MEWLQETLNICAQLHELMVNVILFTALHNDVSEADDDSILMRILRLALCGGGGTCVCTFFYVTVVVVDMWW